MKTRRSRPRDSVLDKLKAQLPQSIGLGRSGVRLATVVLVVLSLWLLTSFVGQIITGAQMDRRKAEAQQSIAQLQAQNDQLATAVVRAESPAYAEQIAREQLGYAREGDTVVLPILPQETVEPTAQPVTAAPTPVPEANWRGWAHAFFPPQQP